MQPQELAHVLAPSRFTGRRDRPAALRPGPDSPAPACRGDPIGLTGDPGLSCRSRPHLHLEIRDLAHARKYNPVILVEADWDSLALVSSLGIGFQRDLDDPRKWQHLDDQPEARVGGPILNDFARPWPPESR